MKKKLFAIVLCLAVLTAAGFGATNVYLFGKGIFTMPVTGTYEEGVTDFSDADGFQTFGIGAGLITGGTSFFGLEVHYNMAGKATLNDPSDDDTVEIDTYQYVSGLLTFGFHLIQNSPLKLYIQAGAGVSYAMGAEEKTYTSSLGYETIISVPDKQYPITGFAGLGVMFEVTPGISVMGSARYQYMMTDDPQSAILILAGVAFGF